MTAYTTVRAAEPQAEARLARTVTAVTGAAALLLFGISLGPMFEETPYLALPYAIAAPILVFGGFGALVLATRVLELRGIRRAHGAYAILFLLVVAAWLPSLTATLPANLNPWVLEIVVVGAVPAAIAWRASVAWGYLLLNSIIVAPIRYIGAGGVDLVEPLQYSLLTLTLGGVFVALAMLAIRNARAVDAATTLLRDAAARSAAAAARAQEQTRLDALVHDEVMSTLFYASRGDESLDESVRAQARHALAQLERLRSGRDDSATPVDAELLVTRLRALVLAASPAIEFEAMGERSRTIPAEVAAAFAEATSEAARNSLVHAPQAQRAVLVHMEESAVRVEVRDNGDGFDPREVGPHRLGVQVSIRGRMATLRGGSASVQSEKGRGTVVTLEWSDA